MTLQILLEKRILIAPVLSTRAHVQSALYHVPYIIAYHVYDTVTVEAGSATVTTAQI